MDETQIQKVPEEWVEAVKTVVRRANMGCNCGMTIVGRKYCQGCPKALVDELFDLKVPLYEPHEGREGGAM